MGSGLAFVISECDRLQEDLPDKVGVPQVRPELVHLSLESHAQSSCTFSAVGVVEESISHILMEDEHDDLI